MKDYNLFTKMMRIIAKPGNWIMNNLGGPTPYDPEETKKAVKAARERAGKKR